VEDRRDEFFINRSVYCEVARSYKLESCGSLRDNRLTLLLKQKYQKVIGLASGSVFDARESEVRGR
jgi:hypothetical protein